MRKSLWLVMVLVVGLMLAPAAAAQGSVEETLDEYYVAIGEALVTGDSAAWIEFFAEDAEVGVPALAPMPVTGKDMIEAAMWPGIYSNMAESTIEITLLEIEGNTATVYAMWVGGASGDMPIQEVFEFNDDGLIQVYTVNVGVPAPGAEEPAALPETGGAGLNLLPGLLVLGGAALAALGRRFSSR